MLISRLLLKDRCWFMLLAVTLFALLAAEIQWMLDHPSVVCWDEAHYFNTALSDQSALRNSGLRGLGLNILYSAGDDLSDRCRPPAYRVLAVPFYYFLGFRPTVLRLVSVGFIWLGLLLLYLTTRKFADRRCAVLSVLVCCLSPDLVWWSVLFYTDYPLFLASAGTFYFLVSSLTSRSASPRDWIGLGLSIGLGLLSKANFPLVAAPVLGFAMVAGRIRGLGGPSPSFAIKAGVVGLLVAGPWWWKNARLALMYARGARNFMWDSLGAPSIGTWISWLVSVVQGLLGHGVTTVIILIALAWIRKRFIRRDARLDSVQRTVLLACACAILPLVLLQLTGTNHLLRHLCPALVPLAIAVGLLAQVSGWSNSPTLLGISALSILAQLSMLVTPVYHPNTTVVSNGLVNGMLPWRGLARVDQWDWRPVQQLSRDFGYEEPRISVLGVGRNLGPPQVLYAWFVDGKLNTRADRLWHYEGRTIDWDRVMAAVRESDIVVTAPGYTGTNIGEDIVDNQHNSELAHRLEGSPGFSGPIRFWMGRFEPAEVDVFVRTR